MLNKPTDKNQYQLSLEELHARLTESEDALRAIRGGEVDALVVPGQSGEQVFSLKGADQTFRMLIEVMNEGAMTLTAEGIIIYANRRLGEIFKSPIEKITGSSIHAWIAPDSNMALQDLLRSDDTQISRRGEVMLLASDGTLISGYLSLNMLQVEDMQGYFCMVATDVTEQKNIDSLKAAEDLAQKLLVSSEQSRLVLLSMIEDQQRVSDALKESELRYRILADSGQALIWTSGTDKKCDYFNKTWLTFTGRTLEQELGDGWIEGVHQNDLQHCITTFTTAFDEREPFSMVYRLRRNDGEYRWILDDGMPRYDTKGAFIGYIGHCLDITVRKLAEEGLARLNQELEQRVITRTADMEKANRELESFSYTVSHDLRAPLRHINGFLTMFRDEVGDTVNEKARHYMDVISESAGQMGQLIDDLLSFSRMGRTELTIGTVDIGKLSDEVIAGFSEEMGEHKIIFVRGFMPLVQGDEAMLRVVLTNLIANAVKFTSRTENRKIEIGCDSTNGDSICYVKDNGAGFDMRYADKLFGVFQRLHNERDFEGTGIGLATIKRIIEQHGGRVWAEGNVDRGAQFYFSLPAKKPGPVGDMPHERP